MSTITTKVFRKNKLRIKLQVQIWLICILVVIQPLWSLLTHPFEEQVSNVGGKETDIFEKATTGNDSKNCIRPSIEDFPRDLFTQDQRREGAITVHVLASIYLFYTIAFLCDSFFVPSIECICEGLNLSSDVAGASFMAIGSSAPELFTNIVGTFITEGDIGVGTILGSAVFNILAVGSCCGLASQTPIPVEWYPLTRDSIFYAIAVALLIFTLNNRRIYWYEAATLVLVYFIYMTVMFFNASLREFFEKWAEKLKSIITGETSKKISKDTDTLSRRASFVEQLMTSTESTPLLDSKKNPLSKSNTSMNRRHSDLTANEMDNILISSALHQLNEESKSEWSLFAWPSEGIFWNVLWLLTWPTRFIITMTVPDCKSSKYRMFFPATFIMCVIWIAVLSYVMSWMMTIIGHTLAIPDSVTGLTFVAIGTSVPEAVSSIVVARQGLGTMSISNSIGSNSFDILVCLGLPWLIQTLLKMNTEVDYVQVYSGGLEYSAMFLMVSLLLLYLLIVLNKFYIDKKVGVILLVIYILSIGLGTLFELNIFFLVNLPTCSSVL